MTARNEKFQQMFQQYREEVGVVGPTTLRDVAAWAISRKLWAPEPGALVRQLAEQLQRALREEFYTDPQGRRVRTKHAARIPLKEEGEQGVLIQWDDIRTASRDYMQISFQQRRQGLVRDCHQLETDVDSFNDNRTPDQPIQMIFDFRNDLEELRPVLV